MKTHFYDRTAYRILGTPVPGFFLRLDEHFDAALSVAMPRGAATHETVLLAESICARLADTELYMAWIAEQHKRERFDREADANAAILNRTCFLGYLGAARALLDACANALSRAHDLMLPRAERTFASPLFWQTLVEHAPNTHRRYHGARAFFNEVFRWGAEMTDRVVPLEMVYVTFGQYASGDAHMKVIDDADADYATLAYIHRTYNWLSPLQLHDRWKPQFLILCEKVCGEIPSMIPIRE